MTLHRRPLLLAAAATLARPALAQSPWPNRTVRVLVGFPPGGSLDVMTRLACEQMQNRLGQSFVVETRTGASGNIAVEQIARATPDGYTIGTISMHNLLINPLLFARLPYDAQRDFQWISAMWDLPNVAVVPANHVPARTVAEFVDWAKRRPGGVTYGSSGVGTTIHLSGAYLMAQAGIEATHVTFRGGAQTITAMMGGDVQVAVDNLATYVGVIQDGAMRPLAVTTQQRWPALPNVPTMAEAGFAGLSYGPWHMWAGPAAMPREIAEKLSQEVRAAFSDVALQQRSIGMGARLLGTTPQQLAERLDRERPIWAEMVRISGARPE